MKHNLTGTMIVTSRQGDGYEDTVSISISDDKSRIQFLDIKMSVSEFGRMLSRNSDCAIEFEVKGLDAVGKQKEKQTAEILIPKKYSYANRATIVKYLQDNHQHDGWELDSYLGSQTSLVHISDNAEYSHIAKVAYFRYV